MFLREDETRSSAVKVFPPFGKWHQSILDPVIEARSRSIRAITSSKLSLLVVLSAFLRVSPGRELREAPFPYLKIEGCRFAEFSLQANRDDITDKWRM